MSEAWRHNDFLRWSRDRVYPVATHASSGLHLFSAIRALRELAGPASSTSQVLATFGRLEDHRIGVAVELAPCLTYRPARGRHKHERRSAGTSISSSTAAERSTPASPVMRTGLRTARCRHGGALHPCESTAPVTRQVCLREPVGSWPDGGGDQETDRD